MSSAYDIVLSNRQEIVERLIQQMEKGYAATRAAWNPEGTGRPYNPVSDIVYKRGNRLRLIITAAEKEFTDPRWMTFKQAAGMHYKIASGSKGVLLEKWIFYKDVPKCDKNQKPIIGPDGKPQMERYILKKPIVNYFRVFNGEQVIGLPKLERKEVKKDFYTKLADTFEKSSKCPISYEKQDRAFYSKEEDRIHMPPIEAFKNSEARLSVLLHEMGHSTGHPDRLNRPLGNEFGSLGYAKEELNAEISSMFLENDLGITLEPDCELIKDHSNYVKSWVTLLRDDPNELFKACVVAEHITDYLMENYRVEMEKKSFMESAEMDIQKDMNLGAQKSEYVKGGVTQEDLLQDDYTMNLNSWEPPARGIKLLNGINYKRGTWKGETISVEEPPQELPKRIISIMEKEQVQKVGVKDREWFIERCDFNEPGYVRFKLNLSENANTYRLNGMYRVHDPQEGPDHKLLFFDSDGQKHDSIDRDWDLIESDLNRMILQMEKQESITGMHQLSGSNAADEGKDPIGRSIAPEYVMAMDAAGYELVSVEDFCFFRERLTGKEIGLDFEPGIYNHLQEMELSSEVRSRVYSILKKETWSITEYDIGTPGYIKFVFDLEEGEKVFQLNGVYKIYEPETGEPEHKLAYFEEDCLEHTVLSRDWDKIEGRLREIDREIEYVKKLAEEMKEAEELTWVDQGRIDRLFEFKNPGIKFDLSGQKFYNIRLSGNLDYVDFSNCTFETCRFYDVTMQNTDFTKSVINAEFRNCIIKESLFGYASIVQSKFRAAEIRNCDFTDALFKGVLVGEDCHLLYNDFLRTRMDDTRFRNREIYPQKNVDTIHLTMEETNGEGNDTYRESAYKEYTYERLNGPVCLDRYRYEAPYEEAFIRTDQILTENSLTDSLSEDVKEFLLKYVVRGGSFEEMEQLAKAAGAQGGILTQEQQSRAAQTINKLRLENWRFAVEIAADIQKSGFTPTWNMVHNMHELKMLTGKSYTLHEVAEAAKNKDQSLFQDNRKAESCIEHIANECRGQELERESSEAKKARQAETQTQKVTAMEVSGDSFLPEL